MSTSSSARPQFQTRVLPVVVLTDARQAVPLAHALLEGGIDAMEITLRHPCALEAIERVATEVPQMQVGAGTITRTDELRHAMQAGARYALSPGCTPALLSAAKQLSIPFIPGAMTPSEVMILRDAGWNLVKLFPAGQAGGLSMLKALYGPLSDVQFCPTGGVTSENLADYLRLPNVPMVGGSWITPLASVEAADWSDITTRARVAIGVIAELGGPSD